MALNNDFTYSLNVNSSLEQVTEPLENWELAMVGASSVIMVIAIPLTVSQWRRFGKTSPRQLKYSLAFMYATYLCSLPCNILSVTQATTPSHVPYYFVQLIYCCFLAASYSVLYAKQDALFNMGMDSIMSETLLKRRRYLVILFKMQFFCYIIGVIVANLFVSSVYTIVLFETATTQSVRVVFINAEWLFILVSLGDTYLSMICLWLFILPVIAFQKESQAKSAISGNVGHATRKSEPQIRLRLYNAARQNVKWTAVSIMSTFLFLTGCHFLQPRFNTAWLVFGQIDVLVKVHSIGKMFPKKSSQGSTHSTRTRRVSVKLNAVADISAVSMLDHVKSEHLFESSAIE